MEENNLNSVAEQPESHPVPPSIEPKQNISHILIIVSLLLLISAGSTVYLFYQNRQIQLQNAIQQTIISTPVNKATAKTELSTWYSVEYPDNFFITSKNYGLFSVADNKFLGNFTHIPEAGIQIYNNVISKDMSLTDWLNGIGDPVSPVGPQQGKSCKDFINQIKGQLKYGDLFNNPNNQGGDCWYFGVSNIVNKTVDGIPAIEFQTENVSAGATHTIFKYNNPSGNISLIDIYFTTTGQSDQNDDTVNAYNSFISTFKPVDPQ